MANLVIGSYDFGFSSAGNDAGRNSAGYGRGAGQVGVELSSIAAETALVLTPGVASRPIDLAIATQNQGEGDTYSLLTTNGGKGERRPDGSVTDPGNDLQISLALTVDVDGETVTVPFSATVSNGGVSAFDGPVSDPAVDYALNLGSSQVALRNGGTLTVTLSPIALEGNAFQENAANAAETIQAAFLLTDGAASTATASPPAAADAPALPPALLSYADDTGVPGDAITSDTTLVIAGRAGAGATVTVRDGDTVLGNATTEASGAWSFATAPLALGAHSFTATATDSAGNASAASAPGLVTIVAPATAQASPTILSIADDTGRSQSDGVTRDTTLLLSGNAASRSRVTVSDGAAVLGTVVTDDTARWTFNTPVLAPGAYSFTAVATNAAGNDSPSSAPRLVTVDTTTAIPVILGFSDDTGVQGDGLTRDPTLVLSGTAEAGATVAIRDGATLLGIAAAGAGEWSFATATLAAGAHSFTAVATDAAGNVSAASDVLSLTVAEDIFAVSSQAGGPGESIGTAYNGPVSYLQLQFLGGSEGEVIIGTARNDFINGGAGADAIDGGAGDDVLDGGTGSSFLTGGTGSDVFFIDGRGAGGMPTWSTITDFQTGEQTSIFGWRPGVSTYTWSASDGAPGFKGATLHADLDGNKTTDTSITWAGKTQADLPTPREFDGLLWFV